jgi:hypothetical protein
MVEKNYLISWNKLLKEFKDQVWNNKELNRLFPQKAFNEQSFSVSLSQGQNLCLRRDNEQESHFDFYIDRRWYPEESQYLKKIMRDNGDYEELTYYCSDYWKQRTRIKNETSFEFELTRILEIIIAANTKQDSVCIFNKNSLSFKLIEIAEWKNNHYVDIPSLQRGLVWAPKQIELLWDSLFRGFPVGSFAVTQVQSNNEIQKTNQAYSPHFFLLDGQQRYNAISIAYNSNMDQKPQCVLWLDFNPPKTTNTTRRYWFKVTTQAHPWGFSNNDNCSPLGWRRYREAIRLFMNDKPQYDSQTIKNLNLNHTWPVEAGCPIVFSEVMNCYYKSVKEKDTQEEQKNHFASLLNIWLKNFSTSHPKFTGEISRSMNGIYSDFIFLAIKRLQKYSIIANVLDANTIEDESLDTDVDGTSNLEHLFTRLNTMGSQISQYDLRYSAIKAYWGDIKNSNDLIAETIMPASHLAILVFRLALTVKGGKKGFSDTPSIQEIRRIGKKTMEDEVRSFIVALYENGGKRLYEIIQKTEKEILHVYSEGENNFSDLPPVIRTSIVLNSPDVYLFLMYLAYLSIEERKQYSFNTQGVALWIHWLSLGNGAKKKNVDLLKDYIDNNKPLSEAIYKMCLEDKSLMTIIDLNKIDRKDFEFSETWKMDSLCNKPWKQLFDFCLWNNELLFFSERQYFNETFQYDPAQHGFWNGHNKPWDIDHIIPKSWISLQGKPMGPYKSLCLQWLWTNGNYAAIPFSINRSKNNAPEWDEYSSNIDKILFVREENLQKYQETITYDEKMAVAFSNFCLSRTLEIYHSWFVTMNNTEDLGISKLSLDELQTISDAK